MNKSNQNFMFPWRKGELTKLLKSRQKKRDNLEGIQPKQFRDNFSITLRNGENTPRLLQGVERACSSVDKLMGNGTNGNLLKKTTVHEMRKKANRQAKPLRGQCQESMVQCKKAIIYN